MRTLTAEQRERKLITQRERRARDRSNPNRYAILARKDASRKKIARSKELPAQRNRRLQSERERSKLRRARKPKHKLKPRDQ